MRSSKSKKNTQEITQEITQEQKIQDVIKHKIWSDYYKEVMKSKSKSIVLKKWSEQAKKKKEEFTKKFCANAGTGKYGSNLPVDSNVPVNTVTTVSATKTIPYEEISFEQTKPKHVIIDGHNFFAGFMNHITNQKNSVFRDKNDIINACECIKNFFSNTSNHVVHIVMKNFGNKQNDMWELFKSTITDILIKQTHNNSNHYVMWIADHMNHKLDYDSECDDRLTTRLFFAFKKNNLVVKIISRDKFRSINEHNFKDSRCELISKTSKASIEIEKNFEDHDIKLIERSEFEFKNNFNNTTFKLITVKN